MKSHVWKAVAVLAAVSVLVVSQVHRAGAKPSRPDFDGKGLEGTWVVTVQQQNCSTNAPLGAPFQSLLTFNPGGTMTETTSNPMIYPALRGPGHGVWARTGWRTYNSSLLAFITLNGALAKTQKITQSIEVNNEGNSFTSDANVYFYDPAGNLLVSGCAAATGTRFE